MPETGIYQGLLKIGRPAEAGVDLAVLQALMGHDHVDSSAAYVHLAPAHVRAAYDAARQRQRAL